RAPPPRSLHDALPISLTGALPDPARGGLAVRSITGGWLVQSRDNSRVQASDLKVVTRRAPTERELADCLFAWTVAKHVKSNAIRSEEHTAELQSRVDL